MSALCQERTCIVLLVVLRELPAAMHADALTSTPPTSPIGDRHLVAGDLQDELLAGFGAHAARVGRCTRDVKLPGQPQRAHFFAWYTPVRAASPPQVAHPVNSGFFVSMPTRRPFSVPT